ncbi:MATE family efflux transporter [Angelakisella massiliensis]|uniref:MATE family efflux transporter n=1 Tax=Angelakisella massiliensis TaxID=1871018 RepID=UPI0008F7F599|nr:MATE family efflux transporter [Angelakisella massiliensis]
MGVMPVGRLLLSMSLPLMISMLVQALYNVVDSMFVSRLSEEALTAVSLAFPAQNLMISVGVGTGVGINALLSRSLGEKNFHMANKTAMNSLLLALGSALVFLLLGVFCAKTFFLAQTNIPEIVDGGIAYLRICCIFSFGMFFQITLERLLQATGRTFYTMITQGLGAIINIILDPIMIFGLFGFPKMGVAGAAVATVLGQIIAAFLALFFNLTKNHDITFSFRDFRPDGRVIRRIYSVGVPSIIMSSIGSVMTFGMNKILISFSSTAAAVFGVYFKLQSFVFMPVFGLNNGMVPILSYNYGARHPDRMVRTIKLSVCFAVCLMLVGVAAFWLIPTQLLSIFNASETMISIGVPALRIISISFLLAGFSICILSVCQSLGHGLLSLSVSVVRQLLVLLPSAFVLSRIGGLDLVWWAFPFAELFSTGLCLVYMKRMYDHEIRPLELEQ